MRRLMAVALMTIGFAPPVCAQHGGGHGGGGGFHGGSGGGFASHSAPSFRGSGGAGPNRAPSGYRGQSPYRGAFPTRPAMGARAYGYGAPAMRNSPPSARLQPMYPGSLRSTSGLGSDGYRPNYNSARGTGGLDGRTERDRRNPHQPYRPGPGYGSRYGSGFYFGNGYGFVPWVNGYWPYYDGFGDDGFGEGYGSGDDAPYVGAYQDNGYPDDGYNEYGYGPGDGSNYGNGSPQPYSIAPQVGNSSDPDNSAPSEYVTLVFRDGHRERIVNYVMSGSTISVYDQRQRTIPISALDRTATDEANRDAGVRFQLPAPSR